MKNFNVSRAIAGGIGVTLLMTIMTMVAPMMGMPKMDIAAMLASMLGGPPPEVGSSAWLVGFGMHLMISIAVPAIGYALINNYLPTSSTLANGLSYGVINLAGCAVDGDANDGRRLVLVSSPARHDDGGGQPYGSSDL